MQTPTALPGGYGPQSQNLNSNYSDTGQSARQGTTQTQAQRAPLPPEPLTEFQKFIASTTGQVLPIFGAELFRNVPSTFAPLNMTPVPSDYVIGPGDELRIRAWGQVNFQANVQVDRSGEVYLPQVGPVHVAGMPFSALDAHLRSAIGRVYRNFDLTADIGQIRAIQVYVAGEARRPGVYTVSSLSTLVDTVFASGGPSIQGSMRDIELRRGSETVADFDLYALLAHGDKSKDVKLLPGDVIFIPPVGAEVAITGSVRNPAIYELRAGEALDGLIADAGGVSAVAAEARISIERIQDHHDRQAMEVAFDASGLKTPLADGDLIRIFSIVPMYQKTVILRGNLANPGRFAWHLGMRLSDLIPDKDSLITRNYWWKRAQLGLPAPEFEASEGLADMRQPADNNAVMLKAPTQAQLSLLNQSTSQQGQYGSQQDQAGSLQTQSGMAQNQPGMIGGPSLSAQQRAGSSSLAAQQTGLSSGIPAPEQRTEVHQLAAEIDWDYAVIERLDPATLKTTLVPFDLGKLVLQHDASQDLDLQAGDVVTIFSEADIHVPIAEQTKLVTLSGEFVHAGVYTVQPGETFRHLVERAGGLTPNAYLYASEYTRESTRRMQQARIDEYVQNLSMEMQRGNLATTASAVSSAQDATNAAASQASEQQLLASLHQIQATGRIVLRFKPDSSGIDSLPDITMENGDQFIVPSVPATVNVVGAVYDQNSFLFTQGRRAGEYLQLAGGPNQDADRKHEFLIRADGEVVGSDLGGGLWNNKFNNLRVYPGDTIVVPEKNLKPSSMRNVIEWSQIISNLGMGFALMGILI
jgi:protein involved in polysaccharide export with SLBB domain